MLNDLASLEELACYLSDFYIMDILNYNYL